MVQCVHKEMLYVYPLPHSQIQFAALGVLALASTDRSVLSTIVANELQVCAGKCVCVCDGVSNT